ncbi:MAG: hypothetical protein KAJ18_05375 [Candidatus Omnitrophica bacterium]|nr:hypothetical protein [Candidatus Omnitrophota bacterium]
MKEKTHWSWKIHFIIYLCFASANALYFFIPGSKIQFYYQIQIGFDVFFIIPFCLNAAAIIFDAVSIIPFFLYIQKTCFLRQTFWQWIFYIRFAVNIAGRSYELNILKSIYHQDPQAALYMLATFLLFAGPSYVATGLYAFKKVRF